MLKLVLPLINWQLASILFSLIMRGMFIYFESDNEFDILVSISSKE